MIRPVTCLCLLAALGSGLYLYSEKHRTALLDRDIGRVMHATEAARARTGMMKAEWALLNEPGRLQDMAGRYLTLHPMAPTQFVQAADLSAHLPAPLATPPGGATDEDEAAAVVASAALPTVPEPAPLPAHHPMQPARQDSHAATRLLAKADARADPRHPSHRMALADRQDPPTHDALLPRGTPLPLAAPQPLGARVYSAMARPMRQPPAPRIVAAVPTYTPVGSALGGAGSLPPPVPYGR